MISVGRPFHKLTPAIVRKLREQNERGMLNKHGAARLLGVNVRTIRYHVNQGKAA